MNLLIIGTGRVAYHLGHALKRAGHTVVGVAGRRAIATETLARDLGTDAYALNAAPPTVDAILIAVSDDAIAAVAAGLPVSDAVVIHTSGASTLDRLRPHPHRAVLWPLISLSPGAPMDFGELPLVTDADTAAAKDAVSALATSLSRQVHALDHAQRQVVHTAAAISLNFPVHLLARAQALLEQEGIDPQLLLPAFVATAQRAAAIGPAEALTGPARRGDKGTIHDHLERLAQDPELRTAYALLSSMILRAYGHEDHGDNHL